MKNIFQTQRSIQIVAVILATLLLSIAFINFFRYITSSTDENLFTNPPSFTSIQRPVISDQDPMQRLQPGDLLLAMNGKRIVHVAEADDMLTNTPPDSSVVFLILRPGIDPRQPAEVSLPKSLIPEPLFFPLPFYVYVIDVHKGGASDRAGMKVGDLIVRINGQTFHDANEADQIMRRGQRDRSINYEILRENKPITLKVKLAIVGFQISALFIFMVGLSFLISGSMLVILRPQFQAARHLGFSCILIGYYLMVIQNLRGAGNNFFSLIIILLMFISLFLATALWLNSIWYFPIEIKKTPKQDRRVKILYVITFSILTIIILTILYFRFTQPSSGYLNLLGIFHLSIFLVLIYGTYSRRGFRKSLPPHYKEMSGAIKKTGFIAGGLAIIIGYLVLRQILEPGYIGLIFLTVFSGYIYTIGKYSLLDLRLRVRRNIQYSVVSLIWFVLLTAAVVSSLLFLSRISPVFPHIRWSSHLIEVVDEPVSLPAQRTGERLFFILAGSGLLAIIWRIGKLGMSYIGRKFYRLKYDYRLASQEISHLFHTNLDIHSLAHDLAQKLSGLMRLKRIGILFFRDERECCCLEYQGFDGREWSNFCLAYQHEIVDVLRMFRSPLSVKQLPKEIGINFKEHGFQNMIPIRSKERLVGLILVGEKMSEAAFQADDFEFLNSVAGQAAVSIDNAFLYEELREQDRMKQELKIARQIQLSSLPQTIPHIPGLDIFGISLPALEVGGDFFDFLNGKNDELLVIVGDVSGKGTSAALYMAKIQGIFRSLHSFDLAPRELFIRANRVLLHDLNKSFFITGLGAKFIPPKRNLLLARAGHLPLLYYHNQTKKVEIITSSGLGFGLESSSLFDQKLEQISLYYEKNDVFVFATDGITEAFNADHQEFGEERLIQALLDSADQSASQIGQHILNQLQKFRGEQPNHDDVTLVVLKAE